MRCDCGGRTKTVDTRELIDKVGVVYVRRRRECIECEERYTTIEADANLVKKLLRINRIVTEIQEEL